MLFTRWILFLVMFLVMVDPWGWGRDRLRSAAHGCRRAAPCVRWIALTSPPSTPTVHWLVPSIVHKEGYAATSTDLSALVTKLRRARPDVILHTGYNPDITLFLRQSKEAGLKWSALIGHGAGYGQIDKLIETFKDDVNYVYNVDPVAAQLLDPKSLKPGLGDLTAEMVNTSTLIAAGL